MSERCKFDHSIDDLLPRNSQTEELAVTFALVERTISISVRVKTELPAYDSFNDGGPFSTNRTACEWTTAQLQLTSCSHEDTHRMKHILRWSQ